MGLGDIISIARSALIETLIISAPVLIVAVGVGLLISVLQAITSIQEQTLTFVPKMVVILVVLIFLGPWLTAHLVNFTQALWQQMYSIVR